MNGWQTVLLVVAFGTLAWFAIGMGWNLRRGRKALRWLQRALPRLGARTTFQWLGSSVVELRINDAEAPFVRATLLVVLEPRDVPWLWLGAHLRGRRDMLVLRGELAHVPSLELDLLAPRSWSRTLAKTAPEWRAETLAELELAAPVASLPRCRTLAARAIADELAPLALSFERLLVRKKSPQLELHVRLPDEARADPERWVHAFCSLGARVGAS